MSDDVGEWVSSLPPSVQDVLTALLTDCPQAICLCTPEMIDGVLREWQTLNPLKMPAAITADEFIDFLMATVIANAAREFSAARDAKALRRRQRGYGPRRR